MTEVLTSAAVPHVVKGDVVEGAADHHDAGGMSFHTPRLDLDRLVWSRAEPLPLADTSVDEIIQVLAAAGEHVRDDADGLLGAALDLLCRTSPYERRILENSYAELWRVFDADRMRAMVAGELGSTAALDGWVRHSDGGSVRAYPSRIIHVLAGNAPSVAALSVVRGALSKGVHLLKLPSNDLLTATTIVRAVSAVAPGHPVARSFSAVYWRGGDDAVEGALCRPQYFDKLIAWGGERAIASAAKYVGPGFELISFDPKNSISMIGEEVFESDASLRSAAAAAALDATPYNQEACIASRFQFVEGTVEQVDRFCAQLSLELAAERPLTSAVVDPPPRDVRDEIDALAGLEPMYRVFGQFDGRGLVIRSDEPVGFSPSGKVVNVVRVSSLSAALAHVNVSTQTVGVFPAARKAALRDALAAAGAQRLVPLGMAAGGGPAGLPHDGFYPLHRMVRWISDQD